ncbi:GrpB family protein [Paenarthrobacter sp. NPDC089989]|uniref:GrpB family protein n=1 Tax=unclassified Paenarthrobacter TaxID=2634190 RepID=UPI0038082A89
MENAKPRRPDVVEVELIGGVEKRHLELKMYDDQWPAKYVDHERRIKAALGKQAIEVEHIGSTSVPGLAAKPVIDILVTVREITAEAEYLDALVAAGYELRVREPGHRMVRTPSKDVHVHVLEDGDPAVDDYLLFRNRLRTDPGDRALYEETKRALLSRSWADMNAYAEAKTGVISAIKARARASRT